MFEQGVLNERNQFKRSPRLVELLEPRGPASAHALRVVLQKRRRQSAGWISIDGELEQPIHLVAPPFDGHRRKPARWFLKVFEQGHFTFVVRLLRQCLGPSIAHQ